jgi:hypothetical protein
MKLSTKSPEMEKALKGIFGIDRIQDIEANRCTWCHGPAKDFRDALSEKEYTISGFCQKCQDETFGGGDVDTFSLEREERLDEFDKPPRQFYTPTANDYIIQRQPMRSGQGEAQSRKYHKYIGNGGRIWLVADQENAAANIYVEGGPNSDGFGGATLTFPLVDGSEIKLKGPWHTNSGALYEATGVDVRDKHYTFVVISRRRESGEHYEMIMADVLYKDETPMLGPFDRGKSIARGLLESTGLNSVALYSQSEGGSSCGFEYAPGKEPRHCKQCMSWHAEGEHKETINAF